MKCGPMISVNRILFLCAFIAASNAKNKTELFGFPETEEDENFKNKENRQPVFLPTVCPETELYYPGDQKDDWICDCRPAFLYHPATDKCWPAFQRGPCAEKEYLILRQNTVVPVCVPNPCIADGYVEFNKTCQRLGSSKPCADLFPIPAALGVNATTLEVGCVKLNVQLRITSIVPVSPVAACPPGCKRNVNAKCTGNT